jgi:flagellar biosynthetic protein FlhB
MSSERTEAPTAKRLAEARNRGQVFKSQELQSALVMLAGALLLQTFGVGLLARLKQLFIETFAGLPGSASPLSGAWLGDWASARLLPLGLDVALIVFGVAAAGLFVSFAQTGVHWAGERPVFDLSRLNPVAGFRRVFSAQGLIELLRAFLKLAVIGLVAYQYLAGESAALLQLSQMDLPEAVGQWAALAFGLLWRVAGAYLVLGVLDYFYQRWQYQRNLRMTRQEVKEEFKQNEGNPQIKGFVRQQQRRLARQRMLTAVPKADVVITNPTHFAVALHYDRATMSAPKVVAKGAALVAQRIKDLARDHGVPVLENPPLARTLYRLVEIDSEVPPDLYIAVAEVLAFVYGVKQRRLAQAGL